MRTLGPRGNAALVALALAACTALAAPEHSAASTEWTWTGLAPAMGASIDATVGADEPTPAGDVPPGVREAIDEAVVATLPRVSVQFGRLTSKPLDASPGEALLAHERSARLFRHALAASLSAREIACPDCAPPPRAVRDVSLLDLLPYAIAATYAVAQAPTSPAEGPVEQKSPSLSGPEALRVALSVLGWDPAAHYCVVQRSGDPADGWTATRFECTHVRRLYLQPNGGFEAQERPALPPAGCLGITTVFVDRGRHSIDGVALARWEAAQRELANEYSRSGMSVDFEWRNILVDGEGWEVPLRPKRIDDLLKVMGTPRANADVLVVVDLESPEPSGGRTSATTRTVRMGSPFGEPVDEPLAPDEVSVVARACYCHELCHVWGWEHEWTRDRERYMTCPFPDPGSFDASCVDPTQGCS